MEAVEAATQSLGAGSSTMLIGNLAQGGRALKVLIRTSDPDIYLGGSTVSGPTNGYEMVPDVEYEIILRPAVGNANSAENGINVKNNGAGTASVSWLATFAE